GRHGPAPSAANARPDLDSVSDHEQSGACYGPQCQGSDGERKKIDMPYYDYVMAPKECGPESCPSESHFVVVEPADSDERVGPPAGAFAFTVVQGQDVTDDAEPCTCGEQGSIEPLYSTIDEHFAHEQEHALTRRPLHPSAHPKLHTEPR